MTPFNSIPLTSYSWGMGAIAVILFGIKSFSRYRKFHTELSRYNGWFGIVMGLAMLFYSVVGFITLDTSIIKTSYLIGEFFLYVAFIVQARILWFLSGGRNIRIFRVAFLSLAGVSLISWLLEVQQGHIALRNRLILSFIPEYSLATQVVLIAVILMPIGYFFIRSGLKQQTWRTRLKPISIGLAYCLVGASSIYNDLAYHGQDTLESVTTNVVLFGLVILALVWPSKRN